MTLKNLTYLDFCRKIKDINSENMRKIDLKSVVWKEREHYVSQCLEVDVSSFGKTKKGALSLYFE